MGFEQVRTYINSGNVVFKTGKSAASALSKRIEERMMAEFGFTVQVITRTAAELGRAIEGNPFVKESRSDPSKVFIGVHGAGSAGRVQLRSCWRGLAKAEQAHCCGKEIYVYYVDGMGQAKLLTHGVAGKSSGGEAPLCEIGIRSAGCMRWRGASCPLSALSIQHSALRVVVALKET